MKTPSRASQLSKKVFEQEQQRLQKSINEAYESLVVQPMQQIKVLPEQIFVEVFLPVFCGERRIEDYPNCFIDWISIAGSPNMEVGIIDEMNQLLFKVPPLFDTQIIPLNHDRHSKSYSEIFEMYELHNRRLSITGENYITQAIEEKAGELQHRSPNYQKYYDQWQAIFLRYGKSQPTLTQPTPIVEDELVYE